VHNQQHTFPSWCSTQLIADASLWHKYGATTPDYWPLRILLKIKQTRLTARSSLGLPSNATWFLSANSRASNVDGKKNANRRQCRERSTSCEKRKKTDRYASLTARAISRFPFAPHTGLACADSVFWLLSLQHCLPLSEHIFSISSPKLQLFFEEATLTQPPGLNWARGERRPQSKLAISESWKRKLAAKNTKVIAIDDDLRS